MTEEIIDVVDEDDKVLRQELRSTVRKDVLMHRACTIIVKNSGGEYFVQKRSVKKDLFPGMYGVGVGETVTAGEKYDEAAVRGLKEEIGVSATPTFLFHITFRHPQDNEQIHVYECVTDEELNFEDEEVAEGFFVSEDELKAMLDKKPFTHTAKGAIKKYWEMKNG